MTEQEVTTALDKPADVAPAADVPTDIPAAVEKPTGISVKPTFGKTVTVGDETYFDKKGNNTSSSLRVGTGIGEVKVGDKTVVSADVMALGALNPKNTDTGVGQLRLNVTAPIGEIGNDVKLGTKLQSRTNLNLEDLGNIDDGALNTSSRLPTTVSGKVGDYGLSGYVVPNATFTTGTNLEDTKLAATLGAQIKKGGTALYAEAYKGLGTVKDFKNLPTTFGLGISTVF